MKTNTKDHPVPLGTLFTRKAFTKWLYEKPLRARIGTAEDGSKCPLATFVKTVGGHKRVNADTMEISTNDHESCINTPKWASTFIDKIDGLGGSITVAEARCVLGGIKHA